MADAAVVQPSERVVVVVAAVLPEMVATAAPALHLGAQTAVQDRVRGHLLLVVGHPSTVVVVAAAVLPLAWASPWLPGRLLLRPHCDPDPGWQADPAIHLSVGLDSGGGSD